MTSSIQSAGSHEIILCTKDMSTTYCLPVFGLKEHMRSAPIYSVTIRMVLHLATDATGKDTYTPVVSDG
uniref:Uncharacterized protein n=1 Tax=Timema monikensis TaxID=170555 RepID=A0A7R9E6I6_9NEOP|nr:unnamed protein product [Timema monikensis]